VTYDFPPRQSSGVFRPVRIYKYLDRSELEVHFLTQSLSRRVRSEMAKTSALDELAAKPTVFTVPNYKIDDIVRGLTGRRGRRVQPETAAEGSGRGDPEAAIAPSPPRTGRLQSLYAKLIMRFYFPDQFFVWGWLTALRAVWLALRHRYDVVYTTSYPESAHLAGLVLSKLGFKWIADYRYGGAFWNPRLIGYAKPDARLAREIRFQRRVMQSADFVIAHSETLRKRFAEECGLARDRTEAISNGYDESDFAGFESLAAPFDRAGPELHLLHLGVWYLDRDQATRMVDTLNALQSDGERAIVLHEVGSDPLFDAQQLEVSEFRYVHHGEVSHDELMPWLASVDGYILSTIATVERGAQARGFLPGKLWEYLRGGRPVLYFGPRDEPWQIVEECGAGLYMGELLDPPDVGMRDIERALAGAGSIDARVRRHSWQSRAEAFQKVLDRILD
jgi:glycosyltransferase involved in cell wall biosynthesis